MSPQSLHVRACEYPKIGRLGRLEVAQLLPPTLLKFCDAPPLDRLLESPVLLVHALPQQLLLLPSVHADTSPLRTLPHAMDGS